MGARSRVEISLSLLTPYLAFWVPGAFPRLWRDRHGCDRPLCELERPTADLIKDSLTGIFFWDFVIWLIEGVLFLMIGFQLRLLMEKSKALPVPEILAAIAIISAIVVIARFLWVFPGTYLPRLASRKIAAREEKPSWKYIVIIGFTGIRGVVSLAVALALPLTLPNGQEFPHRDLILLVTFGVITFTLVGIGLTLPILVRLLGLSEHGQLEAIRSGRRRLPRGEKF
jgi:CPA1 family monovalent cation:H+ antiporter